MKQIKGDAAHAPGVVVFHGVAIDLGRMQMQKDVAENAQRAAARRLVVLDAKDGAIELGLFRVLEAIDLLFALFLDQLLDVFGVFADAVDQPGPFAVSRSRRFLPPCCSPRNCLGAGPAHRHSLTAIR